MLYFVIYSDRRILRILCPKVEQQGIKVCAVGYIKRIIKSCLGVVIWQKYRGYTNYLCVKLFCGTQYIKGIGVVYVCK